MEFGFAVEDFWLLRGVLLPFDALQGSVRGVVHQNPEPAKQRLKTIN